VSCGALRDFALTSGRETLANSWTVPSYQLLKDGAGGKIAFTESTYMH